MQAIEYIVTTCTYKLATEKFKIANTLVTEVVKITRHNPYTDLF